MRLFDICVITASDSHQATAFEALLTRRIEHGLYPREVDFRVYADPDKGRVGSGGGTLLALYHLLSDYGVALDDRNTSASAAADFLSSKRILIIHAGGESRRLPLYAPEGKLFAPVPVPSSSVVPPVVLDLQLSLFFKYPWKTGELVISSGDVIIDFETYDLSPASGDICGFAKAAPFAQGAKHGVFAFDSYRSTVTDYYQKADAQFLSEHARIEGTDECGLDIGIVSMSPAFAADFLSLLKTPCGGGNLLSELKGGRLSFDLYLEVLTACLSGLSLLDYTERLSCSSKLIKSLIPVFYETLNRYPMTAILTRSCTFLHFGTLTEFPNASRRISAERISPFYGRPGDEIVPDVGDELVLYNSMQTEVVKSRPFFGSTSGGNVVFCENVQDLLIDSSGPVIVSGVQGEKKRLSLPPGICVDERRIEFRGEKRTIRLVYGMTDTFLRGKDEHELVFCGIPFDQWLSSHGLTPEDVWQAEEWGDLLKAHLFVCTDGNTEIDDAYLTAPPDPVAWGKEFRSKVRVSIAEVNRLTDVMEREAIRIENRSQTLAHLLEQGKGFRNLSANDFAEAFRGKEIPESMIRLYEKTDDPLLSAIRGEILSRAGVKVSGRPERLSISFVERYPKEALRISVKEDQIVWARAPVRLDIAGGWSDTPPYTNRFGGAVVNVACNLNGQDPIQVFIRRTKDLTIRIHSIDLGVTETLKDLTAVRSYNDPKSPFALPKAALVLLGIGDAHSGSGANPSSLTETLKALGGGLEITLLCAVPKGSGLGTSSILGAVILGAMHRFFGLTTDRNRLHLEVLEMEQMLTTGGGWQDQIGGAVGGVKYIETKPSLKPDPVIHQLDPFLFEEPASMRCMTLYYTGITRLAKNILQDVVSGVNANIPSYLFTHDNLKNLAAEARDVISLRDMDGLGRVLAGSFAANKLIHPSTTNSDIELMAKETAQYCRGMKLLGAGGGGFAFFVSKDERSANALRSLLTHRFEDDRARLVDISLNKQGLEVTAS